MASPRSSSQRGSSQRAPVRPQSGIHPGLIIAALALGGIALYFFLNGSSNPANAETEPKPAPTPAKVEPTKPKNEPLEKGFAKAGKPPKKPAPTLDVAVFQKTDAWFREADAKYTEGQVAKNKSDSTTYQKKVNEAFALIEKIDKELEPYLDWQMEADMGNWAMPSEYDVLLKKIGSYSQLKVNLKRSKTLGSK